MSDYTLLEAVLELGGHVVSVEPSPAGVPCGSPAGSSGRDTLSTVHIRPHVEYRAGAGILKSHRGGPKEPAPEGGIRGEVKGFSNASRLRLMRTVASVKLDAELPLFITLTYPETFPDAMSSKRHIKMFFQRLNRAFPGHGSIWKLEPQKRGAPHYHILTWGLDLDQVKAFVPGAWFDIAGSGDIKHLTWHEGGFQNQHCVQQVYSRNGVMRYAEKYLSKTFEVEGWKNVGRYWGVVNRDNVPFGELIIQEVTRKQAVETMRYQRRFAGLKGHGKKSQTIFCDADQWIEKIGLTESH